MVSYKTINRLLISIILIILALGSGSAAAVELESTWPSDKVSVNVPPREFKLELSEEVNTADHKAFLKKIDEDFTSELGKITKGKSKTTYFNSPLLTPGEYTVIWKTPYLEKETMFTIKEPVVAPGGGNHRHEFSIEVKSFTDYAYTALIFLVVFILVAPIRFKKNKLLPLVALGAFSTIAIALRSIYSVYEKSGEVSSEFWENLTGSGLWSQGLVLALLIVIPFFYYNTNKWVLLLCAAALSLAHYGSATGHPSIPYVEAGLFGGVVLVLSGLVLNFLYASIYMKGNPDDYTNIKSFTISKMGVIFIIAGLLLSSGYNFTLYSGLGVPYGAFVFSFFVKVISVLFILLLCVPAVSSKLSTINKNLKIIILILSYAALFAIAAPPPISAGI